MPKRDTGPAGSDTSKAMSGDVATQRRRPAFGAAFDPWTVSFEDGLTWLLANDAPPDDHDKWMNVWSIRDAREQIENGSGFDVLRAVDQCAKAGLAMPDWLAVGFRRRFRAVAGFSAKSWDDDNAFGKPFPKGTHTARLSKDARASPVIHHLVRRILKADPTRAIDGLMFEEVAEKLKNVPGLGQSECQRIYFATVKQHESIFGPAKPVVPRTRISRKSRLDDPF